MVVLVVTLLTAVIVDLSFATRLDSRIAANVRDAAHASELARSGYEVALSLLLDDVQAANSGEAEGGLATDTSGNVAVSQLLQQARDAAAEGTGDEADDSKEPGIAGGMDTTEEAWARMDLLELPLQPNEALKVEVDDLAGRVNLNAIISRDQTGAEKLNKPVFNELTVLFQRALDSLGRGQGGQIEGPDGEDLAYAVADWVDADEIRLSDGSFEDQVYNSLKDAYSSKNGPFDSVAELQLVDGIDDKLYAAVRDSVTVYPFQGGGGINVNTAPESVLRSIGMRENDATEVPEPLSDESVGRILEARDKGIGIADLGELKDLLGVEPTAVFSPSIVFASNYFRIRATGTVNETSTRLEAVVQRKSEGPPDLLYWRME
jgi:general secretion pathway protein K